MLRAKYGDLCSIELKPLSKGILIMLAKLKGTATAVEMCPDGPDR